MWVMIKSHAEAVPRGPPTEQPIVPPEIHPHRPRCGERARCPACFIVHQRPSREEGHSPRTAWVLSPCGQLARTRQAELESLNSQHKETAVHGLVYHGPGKKNWETLPDPSVVEPTDAVIQSMR